MPTEPGRERPEAGFLDHETEDAQAWWNAWKERIASEFGVIPGPEATARANGSIGGEMTKRMVGLAEGPTSPNSPSTGIRSWQFNSNFRGM